jgi:hypothetical protein
MIFWKFRLPLEPNSTFLSFNLPAKEVYEMISSISVERVFKTVSEYKNNIDDITQTPNSLNCEIKKIIILKENKSD